MDGNFPNLEKETDFQAQETQRVKNKINPNRDTKKHIINMQKLTIKTEFKEARKKYIFKRTLISLSADLLKQILQAIQRVLL